MRNVPLDINQTFFLSNVNESDLTDAQVAALVEKELQRRSVKVRRVERDGMGCVNRIHLDIG